MNDEERKLHNSWVLSGIIVDHSDDGRGRRLIQRDGHVFMFDERRLMYREVSVLAKDFVKRGFTHGR